MSTLQLNAAKIAYVLVSLSEADRRRLIVDGDALIAPDDLDDTISSLAAVKAADMNSALLAAAKTRASAAIIAFADTVTSRITARYPAAEVASWPTQEMEARAVKNGGGQASAPLLQMLAEAADETLDAYADRVLAKATEYRAVVTAAKAIRDQVEAAVTAARTADEIDASLATAKAAAEAKASELGLA